MSLAVIGGLIYFGSSAFFQKGKVYEIGVLVRGETYRPAVEGFLAKMNKLGYVEGRNVKYFIRYVDKKEDLPKAVEDFLKEEVDLIHTYSTPATTEAYRQTKTIPIVFGSMGDPLASKVIESLEHPRTNVTGVSSLSVPLTAKRLEFLKEAVPSIRKVAFPFTPEDIPAKGSYNYVLGASKKLGVEIVPYYVTKERDAKATAAAILKKDVDGIVIAADSAVWAALTAYIEQAKKEKLPLAVFDKDMVEKGGLIGYGPDYFFVGEQSARFADKILKGANPADLPVENPQKIILIINLKAAKEIGIKIPDTLLLQANKIYSE